MTTRRAGHTRTTASGKVTQVRPHSVKGNAAAPRARRAPQRARGGAWVRTASTASLGTALGVGLIRLGVLAPLAVVVGVTVGLSAFIGWTMAPPRKRRQNRRARARRVKRWAGRKARLGLARAHRRLRPAPKVVSTAAAAVTPPRKGKAPASARARRGPARPSRMPRP